jgi:bifunctional NMN adenylyltransferase/nudix hydrolase
MENEKEYDIAVFIGRFQPLHFGHEYVIRQALEKSKIVTVLIGSSFAPRNYRNPWLFEERKKMVVDTFWEQRDRLVILPIEDTTYNDTLWVQNIQHAVADVASTKFGNAITWEGKYPIITLIGHSKDETSYYLKLFPQWGAINVPAYENNENVLAATTIRESYFNKDPGVGNEILHHLPDAVQRFLIEFRRTNVFKEIVEEYEFIQTYKKSWETAPYSPIFVTTDAVVFVSGHILLIERKARPGKGLWALPGGFLNPNETILNGTIRELREETKIKIPVPVLKGSIVATKVFDDPNRSSRGRTITNATLFNLVPDVKLPTIKGNDDARKARWWPSADVKREIMFEDHYDIIQYFIGMV